MTRPTPQMRRVIAEAEVGDDVLGDDPTTRRLEARVAELLDKEAALFFPSGIMANQAALAVSGAWGAEVILEAGAHILHWEDGAPAALSGLQLRAVAGENGLLRPEDVEGAVRRGSPYLPASRLVAVENTHLASGGKVMPLETARGIREVAQAAGLAVHLDGARLWNACAATGHEPAAWAREADTVMVSLSKGLGAPVGSVLAGPRELMDAAWRVRRRLGGGMRQTGLLAAAGLYALDHHRERLVEDHAHAASLARAFAEIPGLRVLPPETNIVLVEATDPGLEISSLLSFLGKHRILMSKFGPHTLRAVTHLDVDGDGISRAVEALSAWAAGAGASVNLA